MTLLNSAHCGEQKLTPPLTARITTAATPALLPLYKATMIHRATQSSGLPLMGIPAVPFKEKTRTTTPNLTTMTHQPLAENRLILNAVPRYLVLLRPLDRPQSAAEQLSPPWKHPGAMEVSDLGLVDMVVRTAAHPLVTRDPPAMQRALLLHPRFNCAGTPPPRAPWSPQSRAHRCRVPRGGTRRSMP